jgi:protein-disulfide isomerase
MPKFSKKSVTVLILVVSVGMALGIKFRVGASRGRLHPGGLSRVKGDDRAPVKVTEFIDFQCPACAGGAIFLEKFMEENPQLIRLEMKYYPLRNHAHGFLSAQYAECAARQGKFWPFEKILIARQKNWSRLIDAGPAFQLIAGESGLDLAALGQCLQDKSVDEFIMKIRGEGDVLGVKSTPTYYVNGKMVVGVNSLKMELNQYLKDGKN